MVLASKWAAGSPRSGPKAPSRNRAAAPTVACYSALKIVALCRADYSLVGFGASPYTAFGSNTFSVIVKVKSSGSSASGEIGTLR